MSGAVAEAERRQMRRVLGGDPLRLLRALGARMAQVDGRAADPCGVT